MQLTSDGWCSNVQREASPNCDLRPDDVIAELLVIHNISLPAGRFGGTFVEDLFMNRLDYEAHSTFEQLRALRVSAHFFIPRDGAIVQFVSADYRAWHAGVSSFGGRERCNDFSIGVELEGTDFEAFTAQQYVSLVALTRALQARYPLKNVIGHEHIASGRKTDPGPFFDWKRYQKMLENIEPLALTREPLQFPPVA